jgi:CHAD domain-containing protein
VEIEAKFAANAAALRRLAAADVLAGYTLGAPSRVEFHDTYLDTDDEALLHAGYACRLRAGDKGIAIQVKGLSSGGGAVHRREELEVILQEEGEPRDWPAGAARDLVLRIAGDAPLQTLVDLRQTRLLRPITQAERLVGELSLDEVTVSSPRGTLPPYQEIEAELRPDGSEEDLEAIVAELRGDLKLKPEERAKFTRALEAVRKQAAADTDDSTAAEGGIAGRLASRAVAEADRVRLEELAAGSGEAARHARALLDLDDGVAQVDVGAQLGITERTVRRWLRAYRRDGVTGVAAVQEAEATPRDTAPASSDARPAAQEETAEAAEAPSRPGITAADTMAAAAVKTLRFHFARMMAHEEGTRSGDDPEDLHDMRVATRRMRAALRVFGDHVDPAAVRPIERGLRHTGRVLGAVRDLDVINEKTMRYVESLPEERRHELDPLLDAWRAKRDEARAHMLAYLDGDKYRRFTERFAQFLDDPCAGEMPALTDRGDVIAHRVADVLPAVIYGRMGAVWAYAGPLAEPGAPLVRYHRLRISGKFLRYTLEFFEEVLDDDAKPLIKAVKELQDHLGDLQDAVVSSGVLRTFLTWGTWERPQRSGRIEPPAVVAPGAATYLAFRQQELQRLVDTFPETWQKVNGPGFGRRLANVVAAIRS